ncbi:MAG: DinB family protein [Ignavibacteria bacterium]|nr:DinB family protein [Ignavibacteria bacterium]
MTNILPPELQKYADEFLQMKRESSAFLSSLSTQAFNKRPESGGWSAAECIDHLIVTGVDYSDKLEEALNILQKKDLRYNTAMKLSWFGKKFINFVEPPVRFKTKSPKKWRPDSAINKDKAAAAYLQLQDRWVDLIIQSADWDLTKVKLPSPATKLIRFTAFEILGVNSAHQRRHLYQAKHAAGKK